MDLKIIRDVYKDGNISTDLISMLESIKDEGFLYYNELYNLRHPLSICKLGQSRFYLAYNDLLLFLGNQKNFNSLKNHDIFNKTKEVIESLCSFIDDTYSIYKCFYNNYDPKYNFIDKGIKAISTEDKSIIEEYKKKIEFSRIMRTANNEIKHNHGRISKINIISLRGNASGFFIQKYVDSHIEPFIEIHKKHNNSHTAWSYNWFLLETFAQYYFISHYAAMSLKKILAKKFNYTIPTNKVALDNKDERNLISLLDSTLTHIVFPDEYNRDFSQITLTDSQLIIKSPADRSYLKRFEEYPSCKVHFASETDSTTRSYVLPYM